MSYTTLIDAGTLLRHLGDPDWRIFDVRHQLADLEYGMRAYEAGHISGAVFLHCDRDLSGVKDGSNGRHPLPDPEILAGTLARNGVSKDSQVVVYDDAQGMIAGRLWWMLRWLGHSRVAVLDGGFNAWVTIGGPTTKEVPKSAPAHFEPDVQDWVVSADEVLGRLDSPEMQIVDARSPDRFRGENETLDPVGGHIPGAMNRFFRDNLAADGRFKSPDALRREWSRLLGETPPVSVVHQCGSGVSACHNLLAMEVAGMPESRLYAGSWSEWCSNPARPIAK